jgi:transcriptional regulator with XRE-family HTH domain
MPIPPEQFGPRLQSLRHLRGFSLDDLAASSGIEVSHLASAERDEAILNVAEASRLAATLQLSLADLLDEDFEPHHGGRAEISIDPLGLGPRIRALREQRNLSLRECSERCGVSAPMLSQIERDETSPTLRLAVKVAAGLGRTLPQLLRFDIGLPALDLHVGAVDDRLIQLLAAHPELMYELRSRRFEELMAALYEKEGFAVELTRQTRDEGVDLYLVRHTSFGRLLTVVDTKRYRPDRPVGVGIVRQLYGAVEDKKASAGVVATTSYFSHDAQSFQARVPFRLGLQDYRDLQIMLRQAAAPRRGRQR